MTKRLFQLLIAIFCSSKLYAQSFSCTSNDPINNDLIACYPFDGNTDDNISTSNNGIVSNIILSTNRFNQYGTCYATTGSADSKISIPIQNFLLNNFSYSIWVKFTSLPSDGTAMSVICNGTPATANQSIILVKSGGTYEWTAISYYNNTSADNIIYQPATVDTSTWYHVVFTRDSASNTAKLYVNSLSVGTNSFLTSTVAAYGMQGEFIVGTRGTAQFADARFDDLRIYKRSLSQSEVAQLFSTSTTVQSTQNTTTSFDIYPNPAQDRVTIDTHQSTGNHLNIINILGQKIYTCFINNGRTTIDTHQLGGAGVYIVQLLDDSEQIIKSQKLTIQNP